MAVGMEISVWEHAGGREKGSAKRGAGGGKQGRGEEGSGENRRIGGLELSIETLG